MSAAQNFIEILNAQENNLKGVSVKIPKNKLVVITGVSGSGKSSLAFDTIYAEGQRRYLETFSAYARQFIGKMERPEVEKVDGLSPVISIEQKSKGWNPRSTVGTTTEIYDFLRLLYARAAEAYSPATGKKLQKFTDEKILESLLDTFAERRVYLLARLVNNRKGHYRELFEQIRKQGYTKCLVDGELIELVPGLKLERYKAHTIELVVDRVRVRPEKPERIKSSVELALKKGEGLLFVQDYESGERVTYSKKMMDPETGISYAEPSPHTFSFNSPRGYCPKCKGLGTIQEVDLSAVIPDDTLSINKGGIAPLGERRENATFKLLKKMAKKHDFSLATPVRDLEPEVLDILLNGGDKASYRGLWGGDFEKSYNIAKYGIIQMLHHWYQETSSEKIRKWAEDFMTTSTCDQCHGSRLRPEAQLFRIGSKTIDELAQMDLDQLYDWLQNIPKELSERQLKIAQEVLKELQHRVHFLLEVGLHYLQLHRPSRTLSGGESQRTRLATQIGSQLTGITYILDEPSIGLHSRDNERLIRALKELVQIGNTVLVVEHDKDIMMDSDFIIDIGPGAGQYGGEIIATGTPKQIVKRRSITADFLSGKQEIPVPQSRREGSGQHLQLIGAKGHNLKDVNLDIPLGKLICVTGVSGSGKSSLIHQTLYPILKHHVYRSKVKSLPYDRIEGLQYIDKVIEIDQSPIGRTPRSNPATYTGVFTDIRKLFADLPESKIRGYKIGRFSFNVKGGRCDTCGGSGQRKIEMNFLPDVYVQCEDCMGRRYNRATLEVLYKGKSINDVLNMSISEAVAFFENIPKIYRRLQVLQSVGLGYLTLGQQATTLSGGEAQRVKLSQELSKRSTGKTIYILDEPTTGLHFSDIALLLDVIQKIVDRGNTMIIIEHNMDVIKCADHIIDVGPDGGRFGGEIVAQGTPEAILDNDRSLTARYLRDEL